MSVIETSDSCRMRYIHEGLLSMKYLSWRRR
uniref:Uncharacterized protein n=1 Tax=Lepeophtheirus salmonis TaxID=72036 RepID=A0A0K2UFB6_LEPSM